MSTRCVGIGRLIGHDYRPRESVRKSYRQHAGGVEKNEVRTYEGEVCTRCGHAFPEREPELTILRNSAVDGVTGADRWLEVG